MNYSTPWGLSDSQTIVAPGIVFYSTPSHGGYGLSPERNAEVLAKFPGFVPFCGHAGWYEEDCDWAAVALTFPDLFPTEAARHADQMRGYISKRCLDARPRSSFPTRNADDLQLADS